MLLRSLHSLLLLHLALVFEQLVVVLVRYVVGVKIYMVFIRWATLSIARLSDVGDKRWNSKAHSLFRALHWSRNSSMAAVA